jgi:RNA polymerase sigma-70 factor (ECF subfamily)
MTGNEALALKFEEHRRHLNRVAYRMLGSATEAEDAVQEAWFRLSRSDAAGVSNLRGWLTTVVARVCLDALRARRVRSDAELAFELEPMVTVDDGPEAEAVLADSVGIALLVVLETLTPAERLAFVLHDMFAVPFDEIGAVLERSPDAARQLASRGRRRVRGAAPATDPDRARQRRLVEAFLAASRAGDFEALVAVLHPDVVMRVRGRRVEARTVEGSAEVAGTVLARASRLAHLAQHALVNGMPGVLVGPRERPISVVAFTVVDGKIASVDVLAGVRPKA